MTRPRVTPLVAAALTQNVPPRILKRLDASPRLADAWTWSTDEKATVVTTDGNERVELSHPGGVVSDAAEVRCSCLLSPRCLHVAAAIALLEIEPDEGAKAAPPSAEPAPVETAAPLHPDAPAMAARAFDVLARVLTRGLASTGALERGELLRVVHGARTLGLHRLASRTLTVAEAARAYREGSADFDLAATTGALADALTTARRVHRGTAGADVVGVARRAYETIGALRLVGVACEPVVTRSGYAGIVSYVASDTGRIFTLEDVMPGDASRALAAYEATLRVGDTALTHRALARAGLFVQNATASEDLRLGAGAAVGAVSSAGATLDEEPFKSLFGSGADAQIASALERVERGRGGLLSRGASLVFLRAQILGGDARALYLLADGRQRPLRAVIAHDDPRFASRDNLRVLAKASGANVALVGRVLVAVTGAIELVMIAPLDEGVALRSELKGRVQIAFDPLTSSMVQGRAPTLVLADTPPGADPLGPLARRVERMVLGGRRSLTTASAADVAREASVLERCLMPTAAKTLRSLLATTSAKDDPAPLAAAWLANHVALSVARRRLVRADWLGA